MKNLWDIIGDISWLMYQAEAAENPRVYALGKHGTVTQYLIDNHIDQHPDKDEIVQAIVHMRKTLR